MMISSSLTPTVSINSLGARRAYLKDPNNPLFGLSEPVQSFVSTSWRHPWDPVLEVILRRASVMANTTPLVTTVTKPTINPADNIQEFCEEHYEDILPIIMEKVRHDGQKDIHTRLDFREGHKERVREDSYSNARARASEPGRRTDSRDSPRDIGHTRTLSVSRDDRHKDRECLQKKGQVTASNVSRSDSSNRRHRKSTRHQPTDEDDLKKPWMCEKENPFTLRIRNFESSRKTRMTNNVKTYDGTGDPEDHVKVFQAAAQNKYVKDPVEIHNIKQRDGETIKDFMKRFKIETGQLTKRLNEHVPKTMEEMMITTTAFIRGEAATVNKKKGPASWKPQDQSKRHSSDKRSDFRGHPKGGKGKVTQSFERVREIAFSQLTSSNGTEGPLVIEAEMVPSTVYGMLKFLIEGGIETIRSTILIPIECALVTTSSVTPGEKRTRSANFTVALHPDFPDQEVVIEGSLSDKERTELCSVLKKNLDIFAWQPSDMTE
nr:hypothetical protein [Tanacetum cinerariifolium]